MSTENLIQESQKQKREAAKQIGADMQMQRESVQQRLAERRRRSSQAGKMNNSVLIQTSQSLNLLSSALADKKARMTGTVIGGEE